MCHVVHKTSRAPLLRIPGSLGPIGPAMDALVAGGKHGPIVIRPGDEKATVTVDLLES